MNKKMLVGSAVLEVAGVASVFLPQPGPWLMPVLVGLGWWIALQVRPKVQPVVVRPPEAATVTPVVEVQVQEVVPQGLKDEVYRNQASVEVLRGLRHLVATQTESAIVRVTEALFSLVQNSREVSAQIEKSLSFLTNGESGLGHTLGNLDAQLAVFHSLSERFHQLKSALGTDIEALTAAVGSINEFSNTLTDLADQTNVLAINASIEAARVGIHGRGFAVIATQVQALAKSSKDIADKMARTVRDVVSNVETSFDRQNQRIEESEHLILGSEGELQRWADHVGPQLETISHMIGDARRLAAVVTEELGDVTVSLQFQDRTKQVLDHLDALLVSISDRLVASAALGGQPIPAHLRSEAFEGASRLFTVREEWDLVSPGGVTPGRATKSIELF